MGSARYGYSTSRTPNVRSRAAWSQPARVLDHLIAMHSRLGSERFDKMYGIVSIYRVENGRIESLGNVCLRVASEEVHHAV